METPPVGELNTRGVAKYSDFGPIEGLSQKRCKMGGKLVLITYQKTQMSFQLVPKSVTLDDLERRKGVIQRYFSKFGQLPGALRKSSRFLSHLLMSSCFQYVTDSCMRGHSWKWLVLLAVQATLIRNSTISVVPHYCLKNQHKPIKLN